jgi:periplasmic divalent cation tolerance protein
MNDVNEEQVVVIVWTTSSMDEARKVARFLVQQNLAACVNITPWTESVYQWEGELHIDQEVKIQIKTLHKHQFKIRDIITEHTDYDVPEISCHNVELIHPEYKTWFTNQCSNK